VGGVLLFHGGVAWLPGGFLGVDAFFVLSGFLITSLLLGERDRTGRIDLVAFWARRARRLLPALLVLLLAILLVSRVLLPAEELPALHEGLRPVEPPVETQRGNRRSRRISDPARPLGADGSPAQRPVPARRGTGIRRLPEPGAGPGDLHRGGPERARRAAHRAVHPADRAPRRRAVAGGSAGPGGRLERSAARRGRARPCSTSTARSAPRGSSPGESTGSGYAATGCISRRRPYGDSSRRGCCRNWPGWR
jgi:hypothetical protein